MDRRSTRRRQDDFRFFGSQKSTETTEKIERRLSIGIISDFSARRRALKHKYPISESSVGMNFRFFGSQKSTETVLFQLILGFQCYFRFFGSQKSTETFQGARRRFMTIHFRFFGSQKSTETVSRSPQRRRARAFPIFRLAEEH